MKAIHLIAATLGAMSVTCSAQTLGVHLASHHGPARDYANANPGLFYRSADGWTGGFYRNSERRLSVYAGWTAEADVWGWRPALTVGAVTGYHRDVTPLLTPSIGTPDVMGWRARIAYAPRLHNKGSEVFHLMLEKDFK